jgi:hypothetical protein
MNNIIELNEYKSSIQIPFFRMGFTTGLIFGFVFSAILTSIWKCPGLSGSEFAFLTALVSGVLFGVLLPPLMKLRLQNMAELSYQSIGSYSTNESFYAETYSHRLPCSYKRSNLIAVGGCCLYLKKGSLCFAPHSMNLKEDLKPVEITLNNESTFKLEHQFPNLLVKATFGNLPSLLVVCTGEREWRFLIPNPDTTIEKIKAVALA